MNLEKFINSKFYNVCEFIWRLVILNFLTLLTSLLLFTIVPSFTACMKSFKDYEDGTSKNVFSLYFENFKSCFKKGILYSFILIIIMVIILYAIAVYWVNLTDEEVTAGLHTFYTLGLYIQVLFLAVVLIIYNQIPLLNIYFDFGLVETVKNSFFMSFRYYLTTLTFLGAVALSALIFLYGTPLWFFIGISGVLYLVYFVSKKKYLYLSLNIYDIKTVDDLGYEREEEAE